MMDKIQMPCTEDSQLLATGRVHITRHESRSAARAVLSRIAVKADFRGKGLGSWIVQELETLAESKGASHASLTPFHYLERFAHAISTAFRRCHHPPH